MILAVITPIRCCGLKKNAAFAAHFRRESLWSSCDRPHNPAGFHHSVGFGVNSALLYSSIALEGALPPPCPVFALVFFFFLLHDAAKVPLPCLESTQKITLVLQCWYSSTQRKKNLGQYLCLMFPFG